MMQVSYKAAPILLQVTISTIKADHFQNIYSQYV